MACKVTHWLPVNAAGTLFGAGMLVQLFSILWLIAVILKPKAKKWALDKVNGIGRYNKAHIPYSLKMKILTWLITLLIACSGGFAQSGGKPAVSGQSRKVIDASKSQKKHTVIIIIRSYNNEYLVHTTEKGKVLLKLIQPQWISRVDVIQPRGKKGLLVYGGMAITINDEKYPNALRILMPYLTEQ